MISKIGKPNIPYSTLNAVEDTKTHGPDDGVEKLSADREILCIRYQTIESEVKGKMKVEMGGLEIGVVWWSGSK